MIIYTASPLIILSLPILINSPLFNSIRTVFQWILKTLIELTLQVVYFAESLPFSQLSDLKISIPQTVLLVSFIFVFSNWIFTKRPRSFILSLSIVWILMLTSLIHNFSIYN
jgi:competence protein ComEC